MRGKEVLRYNKSFEEREREREDGISILRTWVPSVEMNQLLWLAATIFIPAITAFQQVDTLIWKMTYLKASRAFDICENKNVSTTFLCKNTLLKCFKTLFCSIWKNYCYKDINYNYICFVCLNYFIVERIYNVINLY